MDFKINLNPIIAQTIMKTIEWAGVNKTDEELNDFCLKLLKDKDFIDAASQMISMEDKN